MRIESLFDQALYGTGLKAPDILYHYTSWEAAENILRSQRFRASAHDCTNDSRELIAADATILDAARAIDATSSSSVVRRILRLFLKTYEDTRIGKLRRTYLVCFSQLRDDPTQWWEYGAKGQGVCLGLRLFDVPHPNIPELATTFLPIEYGQHQLRDKVDAWHAQFVSMLRGVDDIEHNWRLSLDTLNLAACAWALATKDLRWQREREVRMIFLAREGVRVKPASHLSSDGTVKRYIEVPVTRIRRMPIAEFTIGPNQNMTAGMDRAINLLASLKYRNPKAKVVASTAASVSSVA